MDKYEYQTIARLVAERDAAQLRARMAAQLSQVADSKLAKAMTAAGFDPKADHHFDDDAHTITASADKAK